MKLTLIVQRYGEDIVGGAEQLCRGVAEGLAARDHDIEVLTSCARSYQTWANHYPDGSSTVNGVRVRRFRTGHERDVESFDSLSHDLFRGSPPDHDAQLTWIDAQGPYLPSLVDHLHTVGGDRDALVFFTYLYYPTVHGIHAHPQRSVLVPTAHDEGPLYLPIYDAVFRLPRGLIFNTKAEARLVSRRFGETTSRCSVIGVGINDLEALHAARTQKPDHSPEPPVLLYAGRIEAGKGVAELLEHARRYRRESGREFRLQLMGETAMELPDDPWIEPLGFVSEADKRRRLADATVLVAPSALESFGIVFLEANLAGTPVLANGGSQAYVEHCQRGNGGLHYQGFDEFRVALDLLLDDGRLRTALADRGAEYARQRYSWPSIAKAYEEFLSRVCSR